MRHLHHHTSRNAVGLITLFALCAVLALPSAVMAQPGGGRGTFGRGFGSGGLLDQVRRENVQTELRLTPEQIEKVKELAENGPRVDFREFLARMREATPEQQATIREEMLTKRDENRKETDAKVKEILSPEQLKRTEQLVLQELGPPALNRSEVAQKLDLTEEQKKRVASVIQTAEQKIRELGFRAPREEREKVSTNRDTELLATLTEDQRKNWNASLGPPLESVVDRNEQRAAPAPARAAPAVLDPAVAALRPFPELGGLLDEVRREHVQAELKLTPGQIEKVADLVENGPRADFRDLFDRVRDATPEQRTALRDEMRAKREEARKAQDVKVQEILSPEQLSRAEQLVLQDIGVPALNRSDVAQKIGLSQEQQKRVASIIQAADLKRRELGFRASREERAKVTADRDAELLEVLSEDQQKNWKATLGPPREVLPRPNPPPRRVPRTQSSPPPSAAVSTLHPYSPG